MKKNEENKKAGGAIQRLKYIGKLFFRGWKKSDVIFYAAVNLLITVATIIFNSSISALLGAYFGITAAMLNCKANKMCFVPYVGAAIFYGIISLGTGYYGEAALNLLYLTPLYAISAVRWFKDKSNYVTVEIHTVTKKIVVILLLIAAAVIPGYGLILKLFGANLPFVNALGTMFSISGSYLSARRMKEQWIIYIVYGIMLVAMWTVTLTETLDNVPIIMLNVVYCVINVRGLITWRKMQKYLAE